MNISSYDQKIIKELIEIVKGVEKCFPTHQSGCMARDLLGKIDYLEDKIRRKGAIVL